MNVEVSTADSNDEGDCGVEKEQGPEHYFAV
jgi:hypothetical protein